MRQRREPHPCSAKCPLRLVSRRCQCLEGDGLVHRNPVALVAKNPPANAGDLRDGGPVPVSGRSPGGGHGNPLQYPCLENHMDRGAWQATVHKVAKSQT